MKTQTWSPSGEFSGKVSGASDLKVTPLQALLLLVFQTAALNNNIGSKNCVCSFTLRRYRMVLDLMCMQVMFAR